MICSDIFGRLKRKQLRIAPTQLGSGVRWNISTHTILVILTEDSLFPCPSARRMSNWRITLPSCSLFSFIRTVYPIQRIVPEVDAKYLDQQHAEEVPDKDLLKSQDRVFYLPMQNVTNESSATTIISTNVCAVFDVLATTSTGISLNSTLMVGPTVHPLFVDVHISRMSRHVRFAEPDKDLHQFV